MYLNGCLDISAKFQMYHHGEFLSYLTFEIVFNGIDLSETCGEIRIKR